MLPKSVVPVFMFIISLFLSATICVYVSTTSYCFSLLIELTFIECALFYVILTYKAIVNITQMLNVAILLFDEVVGNGKDDADDVCLNSMTLRARQSKEDTTQAH